MLPQGAARKILRSIYEGARDMARDIAETEEYAVSRKLRKKVEMLFAHLKRILKLDRLRLRGQMEPETSSTSPLLPRTSAGSPSWSRCPRQPWREAQGCLLSGPSGRDRQRPRTDFFNGIGQKPTRECSPPAARGLIAIEPRVP